MLVSTYKNVNTKRVSHTLPMLRYSNLSGRSVNSRGEPYTLTNTGPNVGKNPTITTKVNNNNNK